MMSGGVWENVPGLMLLGYKDKKDLKCKTSVGVCDTSIPLKGVSDSDQ